MRGARSIWWGPHRPGRALVGAVGWRAPVLLWVLGAGNRSTVAALGVVLMTPAVFGTFTDSLTAQLTAAGQSTSRVDQVAEALRDRLRSRAAWSQYSVPLVTVQGVETEPNRVMVDARWAQGLVDARLSKARQSRPA